MKKGILIIALMFASLCYFGLVSAWSQGPGVQCSATAKSSGKQCRNKTLAPNGLCRSHGGNAGASGNITTQCTAMTKKGTQCKLHTSNTNGLCHIHNH